MPTDPVCGMFVPKSSDLFTEIDGKKYYFCSKGCLLKFSSPEKEAKTLKRRLILSWVLSVPILLITYVFGSFLTYKDYILLALAIPVQFYAGYGFYDGAWHSLKSRSANMDLLVSLGTLTAFFFSLFLTIFPNSIPSAGIYFDASSFIITLILTGNYIENLTKRKANRAAEKLLENLPSISHLVDDTGKIIDVPSDTLVPGQIIIVRTGETFPADGSVEDGLTEVDESMLTGEQTPVLKEKGNNVSSGTINLVGPVKIRVTNTGMNTTIRQIYDMIERASSGRAKVQRVADVFSYYFVPVVLASAIASSLFWYFYLGSMGYKDSIEIAVLAFVSVIVIACPCAIGLAGPITLLISSNISSENGIIIKNTSALDRLSRVNRVILDKTGTITEPVPVVQKMELLKDMTKSEVLEYIYPLEKQSNHPVARAIVNMSEALGIKTLKAENVKEIPGHGMEGYVEGKNVNIIRGNVNGGSLIRVKIDDQEVSSIIISYKIRDDVKSTVSGLNKLGIKVSIVSGDSYEEVKRIGDEIGVSDIYAGIKPDQKAEILKEFQMKGDYVMFVGDGINDSIALETADVGVSMGSGSDIAKESGDILLLNNRLESLIKIKLIGNETIRKVKQNIGWAFGYNAFLIPIAAGLLVIPFGLWIYTILPILSALAMGMSSSSVVTNSLLLRGRIRKAFSVMS
ncbi:heavy metal translocating P-type ATPase [Cuniculiplasma sp. SKW3]|uniref:heavy metal translocating P-type ATPase n=1 Tax=Cuniculiplasma sp. SKW3 TaxID=3400170 RepID=UPI003FD3549B